MQLRPEIQIRSILKAMTDVVLPAVDPNNKLAQEQAGLCMGLLTLMAQQLPVQFRFDCDELGRLIELSWSLESDTSGDLVAHDALSQLKAVTQQGGDVLERAKADPAEVLEAVRNLRSATSAVVKAVYKDHSSSSVSAVQRTVLRTSQQQLLRDRSLLLAQNWESDPMSIPPISQLLGSGAA